jgi:hypothetical protein
MTFFGLFGSEPKQQEVNLAEHAFHGKLTVKEVNAATKEKLEKDMTLTGDTVLVYASERCGIKVVEAILDKGVNIDGLSGHVSIVV